MYTSCIHGDNEKVKLLALATRLEGEGFQLSTSQEADIQRFCRKRRKALLPTSKKTYPQAR